MTTDWLAGFLQANDPLFPTGAYAHSFGLEEIVRLGVVRDEVTLLVYLQKQVIPNLQSLELPFVRYAYEAAVKGKVEVLCGLNEELSAVKICREAREASANLGFRRLQAAAKISEHATLKEFLERTPAPHHILAYGAQMAANGVPLEAALSGYFYQALASSCSAALKLIRIGQDGVQRVLREGLREADSTVKLSLEVPRNKAGWFNPLLEIAAMRHERANERLFIS